MCQAAAAVSIMPNVQPSTADGSTESICTHQKLVLHSTHLLHLHTCSYCIHSALPTPQHAVCSNNAMLRQYFHLLTSQALQHPPRAAKQQCSSSTSTFVILNHILLKLLYLSLPLVPCAVPLFGGGSSSGAEGARAHPVRGQHINIRLLRRLQRSAFAAVRGEAAVIQKTQDSPSYAARAVAVMKLPPAARQPQRLARRSWPRFKYLHAGRQARLSSTNLLVQRQQIYTACGRCWQAARADNQLCTLLASAFSALVLSA